MHRPVTGDGEGQDSADGGRFHDRAKSFVEVDAVLLGKTAEDPASLVAIKGAIGFELMTIYPFAGDDVGAGRTRDELPRVVEAERVVLALHGGTPIVVIESRTVCPRNRRHDICMKIEVLYGLPKTAFSPSGHVVLIDNRSDGDGIRRRRYRRWYGRSWSSSRGGRASGKTMAGISSSRKVKSAGEGGVGCSAKGKEFSSKVT